MDKENVGRASSILTESVWEQIFPNALSIYTYDNFLQAMAKFPKFCGEMKDATDEAALQNACKIELATLLAHIEHNSEALTKVRDSGDCAGVNCGRGALLLSGQEHYEDLSSIAFNGAHHDSEVLLDYPDLVATDGRLAFLSAFKVYMQPTAHAAPTMHDTILGFYEPSSSARNANVCTECFGTTTNILNGDNECRSWNTTTAGADRAFFFNEFCDLFGAECPAQSTQELNCKGQGSLSWGSTGVNFYKYIAPYWFTNKCYFVSWATEYSVFNSNDYRRCVCDRWDPQNARCMDIDQYMPSEEDLPDPDPQPDSEEEED